MPSCAAEILAPSGRRRSIFGWLILTLLLPSFLAGSCAGEGGTGSRPRAGAVILSQERPPVEQPYGGAEACRGGIPGTSLPPLSYDGIR